MRLNRSLTCLVTGAVLGIRAFQQAKHVVVGAL